MRDKPARGSLVGLTLTVLLPLQIAYAQIEFDPPITLDIDGEGMYMWEDVAIGDNGVYIAVWASSGSANTTHGNDGDIIFSRSADSGATWSAPALLNSNGDVDSDKDYLATMATDGLGNWVAAWAVDANPDGYIVVSRSTDDGLTWNDPALVPPGGASDNRFDYYPELTLSANGTWILNWNSADYATFDYEIYFARSTDGGASWSTSAPLNTTAASESAMDHFAKLATDGSGNWVAVWEINGSPTGPDGDVYTARSADDGLTWTPPALLSAHGATDSQTDNQAMIATDGAGLWNVIWSSSEDISGDSGTDADIWRAQSSDNGATWTAPTLLNTTGRTDDETFDYVAALGTNGSGTWVAIWSADGDIWNSGVDREVIFAESQDGGATWSEPRLVASNSGTEDGYDFPRALAVDPDGSWVVIWAASDEFVFKSTVPVIVAVGRESGGGGGDSSTCFIATAAFGTPMAAELDPLRSFRDKVLLAHAAGGVFADAYYRLSPPIAQRVARNSAYASAIRMLLVPIIRTRELSVAALITGIALLCAAVVRWRLRES